MQFMDGFDHYNTESLLGQKWTNDANYSGGVPGDGRLGTGFSWESGSNRRGDAGFSLGIPSGAGIRRKVCTSTHSSGNGYGSATVGMAIRRSSASSRDLLYIGNHTTSHTQILRVCWNPNGSFTVYDRSSSVVFTTTPGAPSADTWYYFEISWGSATGTGTPSNTTAYVAVDGIQIGTGSGDFWPGSSTAGIGAVAVGCTSYAAASTGPTLYIDDFFFAGLSTGGNVAATFYGPISISTITPSGNGALSQWTGSDGNSTDNYQHIDEALLNTADYVTAGASNLDDSYSITQPSGIGAVRGVMYTAVVKRAASAPTRLRFVTFTAGTSTLQSSVIWDGAANNQTGLQLPTTVCMITRAGSSLAGLDLGLRSVS